MNNLLASGGSAVVSAIVLVVILFFALYGFIRGFARTFISIFGTILSLLFAILLCSSVTEFLESHYSFVSFMSDTPYTTLPYHLHCCKSQASVTCLAPLNFPRKITRPVSYYALFERVAASKPTSWLFSQSHIVFHLACIGDLSCGSGLLPF